MRPVSIAQLRATATVDLMTAARALGIGRTKAYELAKHDEFPCPVIRVGEMYRIPTPGLLELLGATAEEPRVPAAVAPRARPVTGTSAPVPYGPTGLPGGLRRRA